jgi:tRNA (guanine-N1)-methyltransferase
MRIQVITLFPDEFRPLVSLGVTGRALASGMVALELLNPRDFARDRHRTVDDRPTAAARDGDGGGACQQHRVALANGPWALCGRPLAAKRTSHRRPG